MVGMARGRKKGMKKFIEIYQRDHVSAGYQNMIALGNADCVDDMRRLREMLTKEDDSLLFVETSIGPTIGCHVGPGMMSCVFWGDDRRKNAPVADRIANGVRRG